MLEGVGEPLLDEPVRREVQPRREWHRRALGLELDVESGAPEVLEPSRSSWASVGGGARSGASSPDRRTPTIRRISASASRPVASTVSSAARSLTWSGRISRRTADACTVITLTLWPMTSCSSRAIRLRSSATATSARSSRSLTSPCTYMPAGTKVGAEQPRDHPRARSRRCACTYWIGCTVIGSNAIQARPSPSTARQPPQAPGRVPRGWPPCRQRRAAGAKTPKPSGDPKIANSTRQRRRTRRARHRAGRPVGRRAQPPRRRSRAPRPSAAPGGAWRTCPAMPRPRRGTGAARARSTSNAIDRLATRAG